MVQLKIDHAGPLVTIQDQGRAGFMRYGVTPAGPMDRMAFALGHYTLAQDPRASIEVSMGGISLTCVAGAVTACVTGGEFTVILDGKTLPPWSTFELTQGSKLQVRAGTWGSWCYLSFAGVLDVPNWLNSASTHLGSNICGAPVQMGDKISINNARVNAAISGEIFDVKPLKPTKNIRVVMGPQDRFFTAQSIVDFTAQEFALTADYNRQGVRLSGPTLEINQALDMPSEPIARGSLQVPGHGDPICLLADHQTTGGYPKIATVITADQDKLAQMRSGDRLRFIAVDVETATQVAHDANKQAANLRQKIDDQRLSLEQKLWNSNLVSGAIDDCDE
jgi:allophanate hydrolase